MKRGTKWTADEDAKLVAGLKADKKPKDMRERIQGKSILFILGLFICGY